MIVTDFSATKNYALERESSRHAQDALSGGLGSGQDPRKSPTVSTSRKAWEGDSFGSPLRRDRAEDTSKYLSASWLEER